MGVVRTDYPNSEEAAPLRYAVPRVQCPAKPGNSNTDTFKKIT